MSFQLTISKEEIRKLPLIVFHGNIHLVDSDKKLNSILTDLEKQNVLGFDTETKPSFKKGNSHAISLLQLSTDTDAYLFRLNKIGLPDRLIDIFEDKSKTIVGADIKMDLRGLKKIKPFLQVGFVDIQKVAKTKGIVDVSVRKLTAIILKYRLSKRQQLSNWEKEELTQGQLNYAATDAYVCLKMFQKLGTSNIE